MKRIALILALCLAASSIGCPIRIVERYKAIRTAYIEKRALVETSCASALIPADYCQRLNALHDHLVAADRVIQAGVVSVAQIKAALQALKAAVDEQEAALEGQATVSGG